MCGCGTDCGVELHVWVWYRLWGGTTCVGVVQTVGWSYMCRCGTDCGVELNV